MAIGSAPPTSQQTGVYYREHFELPFFNSLLKDKGDIRKSKKLMCSYRSERVARCSELVADNFDGHRAVFAS